MSTTRERRKALQEAAVNQCGALSPNWRGSVARCTKEPGHTDLHGGKNGEGKVRVWSQRVGTTR